MTYTHYHRNYNLYTHPNIHTGNVSICRFYDITKTDTAIDEYMGIVHIQSPSGGHVRIPSGVLWLLHDWNYGDSNLPALYHSYPSRMYSNTGRSLHDVYDYSEFQTLKLCIQRVLHITSTLSLTTEEYISGVVGAKPSDGLAIHPDVVNTLNIHHTAAVDTTTLTYYDMSLLISLAHHFTHSSFFIPHL